MVNSSSLDTLLKVDINEREVRNINKNIRLVIGLIGNIILCFYGIRGLLMNELIPFASYLFAIGGFIGIIALILELKKKDAA